MPNVVIVGAGPAGAYLAYLMRWEIANGESKVTIVDKLPKAKLGEKCACGTHVPKLKRMFDGNPRLKKLIDDLVMFEGDKIDVHAGAYHTTVQLDGIATVDKWRLLHTMIERSGADFYGNTEVVLHKDIYQVFFDSLDNCTVRAMDDIKVKGSHKEEVSERLREADIIVDATGYTRAILGRPSPEDDRMICYQTLCEKDRTKAPMWKADFKMRTVGTGYIWEFPYSDEIINVGAGTLEDNPRLVVEQYIKQHNYVPLGRGEGAVIRLTPPSLSKPILGCYPEHRRMVVGVGESIGCVSPLTGEGILPSMECAKILYECDDIGMAYEDRVMDHFKWLDGEYGVYKALKQKSIIKAIYRGAKIKSPWGLELTKWQLLRMLIGGIREAKIRYGKEDK